MLIQRGEELRAAVAIGRAVVPGQRRTHNRPDSEHPILRPRRVDDLAEPNQRHLRRIDYAVNGLNSEIAQVRDGYGTIGDFGTS